MTDSLIQSLFDSALGSEFAWRRKAQHLLQSGVVILRDCKAALPAVKNLLDGTSKELSKDELAKFEQYMSYDVGFMLIGLSLENLLKGLWAAKNPERFSNVTRMNRDLPEISTHSLCDIASNAGLPLMKEEREMLQDLTEIVLWYGRYTAPTTHNAYRDFVSSGPPSSRFNRGTTIFDIELPLPAEIESFLKRILDEFRGLALK